jgi:hypothetical protein
MRRARVTALAVWLAAVAGLGFSCFLNPHPEPPDEAVRAPTGSGAATTGGTGGSWNQSTDAGLGGSNIGFDAAPGPYDGSADAARAEASADGDAGEANESVDGSGEAEGAPADASDGSNPSDSEHVETDADGTGGDLVDRD